MPLHVKVYINDHQIEELHIGRATNNITDTQADNINTYIAVIGDRPTTIDEWIIPGIQFNHRYGDGALICVQKALNAVLGEAE